MWVCRLPVHIGPAEHTIFTGIFGEFVTFIGPTESSAPTKLPRRCHPILQNCKMRREKCKPNR